MDFKGILIGGLLPALAFGATGLLQKVAARSLPCSTPLTWRTGAHCR